MRPWTGASDPSPSGSGSGRSVRSTAAPASTTPASEIPAATSIDRPRIGTRATRPPTPPSSRALSVLERRLGGVEPLECRRQVAIGKGPPALRDLDLRRPRHLVARRDRRSRSRSRSTASRVASRATGPRIIDRRAWGPRRGSSQRVGRRRVASAGVWVDVVMADPRGSSRCVGGARPARSPGRHRAYHRALEQVACYASRPCRSPIRGNPVPTASERFARCSPTPSRCHVRPSGSSSRG